MDLINGTRMLAAYTMGVEPSGRELLVVVVKGTFALPERGEPVRLHDDQVPLIMADTFTGEPGVSAAIHEADFAPRKHRCDVLLVGKARPPDGRPAPRMFAGIQVGNMQKIFEVVGNRFWRLGVTGITASSPQPFTEMLVSYDTAFGGTDRTSDDESDHDAYLPNPVGRGWLKHGKKSWEGLSLPNTEEVNKPVHHPSGNYRPMALGPLGRGWPQRARFAGTYDQKWLSDECPFLPKDFDERYYQAAPEDQQIPFPKAPVEAVLRGFTNDGFRQFMLPYVEMPVHVFPKRGGREDYTAVIDTIVFEPDQERFTMTWRAAHTLRKSMHEVAQVLVGARNEDWWWKHEESRHMLMKDLAT